MDEKNGKIIQIIIQSGAVAIALYLVFILNDITSNHINSVGEHIKHNTQVLTELKSSIEQSNEIGKEQTRALADLEKTLFQIVNSK